MQFDILETLSLPGDPAKPNEDAVLAEAAAAVVLDGATPVSEPLMPGRSDAAWIAQFGARRLLAHVRDGDSPRAALRHALADAERSFLGLRRRAPRQPHEMPCAAMIFAMPNETGFDALWYGDCAALVLPPGRDCEVIGGALDKRAEENGAARRFLEETGLPPIEALKRPDFLPLFQAGRAKLNEEGGLWLFSPFAAASEHVSRLKVLAAPGTRVLLCSDGFLALVTYGLYHPQALIEAAAAIGVTKLGDELRAFEASDPEGLEQPRFKKSDDATAVLLQLA